MVLIATSRFDYARARYEPGDRFEASDDDAKILIEAHLARVPENTKSPRSNSPRDSRYNRRDLRASGE